MKRPKLLPWLGLGFFVAVQAICLYVLFGFAHQALVRYEDFSASGSMQMIPKSIQAFLDSYTWSRNNWYLWIPLLAAVLFGAGWMTWKHRDKSWPGLLLFVLAAAELGTAVAMVVVTYQDLASIS